MPRVCVTLVVYLGLVFAWLWVCSLPLMKMKVNSAAKWGAAGKLWGRHRYMLASQHAYV